MGPTRPNELVNRPKPRVLVVGIEVPDELINDDYHQEIRGFVGSISKRKLLNEILQEYYRAHNDSKDGAVVQDP